MRCYDRKCSGRLHLNIELDEKGKKIYLDPIVASACSIKYSDHNYVKNELISRDMDEKKLSADDWKRRSVQMVFVEKKLKDQGASKNVDILKVLVKESPQVEIKITSRDITIVKQNVKKRALETHKEEKIIDKILNSTGQPLLIEKV